MTDQVYREAANTIVSVGQIPFPVTDTLVALLQVVMTEEQAAFLRLLNKPMNHEQISETSGLEGVALENMLNKLMDEGIISGIPSKSTGVMVYRALPPIPGLFEYTLMRGETGEKQKTLARLFEQLFEELADMVQANYDTVAPAMKSIPAMSRVIPVNKEVDRKFDTVMPYEDVKKVIDRFDTIAVVHCYCRHQKDLLQTPCQVSDQRENCLTFGQSAKFVIDHKFGKQITRDQALAILDAAENDGLVHKAFHEKFDTSRDEMAICNCCKCCCETFQGFYRGWMPAANYTSYKAIVVADECTGCEICVDICPMEAVSIADDIARIDESRCIGCGVCAYHCTTEALKLERTGQREVMVLPARRTTR